MSVAAFMQALETYRDITDGFLAEARARCRVHPDHLSRAVCSYLTRPAKRLRPALLLMACEAVGGDLRQAAPAAAAVELFHTWTLVHDDIIDNDRSRRGGPTVHVEAAQQGRDDFGLAESVAERYGRDVAILAGDIQQGWATTLLCQCAERGIAERVVLALVQQMAGDLNRDLIEGEMLDVQFACRPPEDLTEEQVLNMMRLKTGALLKYAATAGAAIGRNCLPAEDPAIHGLGNFAERCGIAFQLQDDILGITAEEKTLGKPVGSDIREGKITLPVLHVLRSSDESSRTMLQRVLGDQNATTEQVERARICLVELGGVAYTREIAENLLNRAVAELETALPPSRHRSLLRGWAEFMTARTF